MDFGKYRNHSEYFTTTRNICLNQIATQTNNLIIRLDKLINRQVNDDQSKKDFEKSIVPWSDNSEFPNCRVCNAKFSITKRRHHCRLCGKIMCNSCSQFLTFISARKLTGPDISSDSNFNCNSANDANLSNIASSSGERRSLSIIPSDSLYFVRNKTEKLIGSLMGSRDGSSDSFLGNNPDENSDRLRICEVCKRFLARREAAMDLRVSQSEFVDVYQKLCVLLTQITNLAPSYKNMAQSLNFGESLYTLEAANELRKKMVGVQREIATLSERIENWNDSNGSADETNPVNIRMQVLQRNIKILAINSLHDAIANMPELPSTEAYQKLISENKARTQHQMKVDREMKQLPIKAYHVEERSRRLRPSSSLVTLKSGSLDDGWVSSSPFQQQMEQKYRCDIKNNEEANMVNDGNSGNDRELSVLQQQYLNIKSYLEQAAQAGRLEEVEILEKSLLDLELEMKRVQLSTPRLAA